LPNFRFCFRLCASSRGGSVFRDPSCTGTGTSTSCSHFASRCSIFDGSPTLNGGTEADLGSDGNRTIAGPLGAKYAPVARHCHLGRVVDLFTQWASVSMIYCGRLPEKLLSIGSGTQFNHQSLCWRSCGIWSGSMFHVPCSESPPEGAQIHCTIVYYYTNDILVSISDWRRQTGEHGRTSCGCILIMLGHTSRKCQGITSISIEWNRHLIPPIRKIWHPRTFPFWLRRRKADKISRWNFIWTSCSYSAYSSGNPAGDIEHSFSRMDETIAKMRAGRWWICRIN
jgi:hypothetical protein